MQVTFKTKESYLGSCEQDEFLQINWLDTGTHLPSGNNLELFLENDLRQRKSVLYITTPGFSVHGTFTKNQTWENV